MKWEGNSGFQRESSTAACSKPAPHKHEDPTNHRRASLTVTWSCMHAWWSVCHGWGGASGRASPTKHADSAPGARHERWALLFQRQQPTDPRCLIWELFHQSSAADVGRYIRGWTKLTLPRFWDTSPYLIYGSWRPGTLKMLNTNEFGLWAGGDLFCSNRETPDHPVTSPAAIVCFITVLNKCNSNNL